MNRTDETVIQSMSTDTLKAIKADAERMRDKLYKRYYNCTLKERSALNVAIRLSILCTEELAARNAGETDKGEQG